MEVNNIVIHSISKARGESPELILSEQILSIDERVRFLAEKLASAFRNDKKVVRCNFRNSQLDFQQSLRNYINQNFRQFDFYSHSFDSIDRLRDLLISVSFATGGYYVFVDYEMNYIRWVGVFVVRDSDEVSFSMNEDTHEFVVQLTKIVNTNKLAMACRINVNRLVNGQDRYLNLTHKQGSESEYFIEWVEAELAEKNKEDTNTLLRIIADIDRPIDPDTGEEYEENKFRKQVHDYISGNGQLINIFDLGERFWDNSQKVSDFAEGLDLIINTEFRSSGAIKKLDRYSYTSGKIKLDFSHKDYRNGTVRVLSDNTVLINSEELSEKIRREHS